jgi:hypothetical protein
MHDDGKERDWTKDDTKEKENGHKENDADGFSVAMQGSG